MQIEQTHHQIDEYALSRQLATFGFETQQKLMQMRVFLHGGTALGIQIAKNLVLMSLKEITIFDNKIVTMKDVGRNFACREHQIGKMTRAEVGVGYLQQLNANFKVQATQNDNIDFISSNYDCVVVVDNYNKVYLQQLNEKCREKNVGFILSGCLGLYGYTFVDFGPSHTVHDQTGEQPKDMIILNITHSKHGVVQLHRQARSKLKIGDIVEFREVEGMIELNDKQFKIVNVFSDRQFEIGDTRVFTAYTKRGKVKQVKIPLKLQFENFKASLISKQKLNKSEIATNNTENIGYPQQLHFILNGVYNFYAKYNRLPKVLDEKDAQELFLLMRQKRLGFLKIDQQKARTVSMYADTQISPVCSFWGGIAAQQVVKFTGKYTPINQWLHYQFFDALPYNQKYNQNIPRTLLTENNRYDDYIALFGDGFFNKLKQLNLLVVGAGSVGGECLKTTSLMGVGTGEKGKITVVDDKKVQKFNLSSHMLLKNQNIGFSKAQCVTKAVNERNPKVDIDFSTAQLMRQNQHIFNDNFWQGQDFVIDATADSRKRQYIDNQCVWFEKPLMQVRINGTECKSLIAIPHITSSIMDTAQIYHDGLDFGSIINYPLKAEHTIQWASVMKFLELYEQLSSDLNQLYTQREDFLIKYNQRITNQYHQFYKKLLRLKKLYLINESKSYQACVQLMIEEFTQCFLQKGGRLAVVGSQQVDKQNNMKEASQGRKRQSQVWNLSAMDAVHLQFIQAGANIYANMMNIPFTLRNEQVQLIVISLIEKSQNNPHRNPYNTQQLTDEQKQTLCKTLLKEFQTFQITPQNAPSVISLDLQNPTNQHINFIQAASLLRSRNFNIQPLDRFSIRVHAAKIKPKVVTTAAIMAGIIGIQMIKYLLHKPITTHKNASVNLALSSLVFQSPSEPIVNKDEEFNVPVMGPVIVVPGEFTKWNKIEIKQSMILCQLKQHLQRTYNVRISTLVYEGQLVYSDWDRLRTKRRLIMRVEDAVSQVIRKKIWRKKRVLCIQVCAEKDGVDCLMPDIKYHIVDKSKQ